MSIERRSPESVEQPSQGALVLFGSSQQQPKGRGYGLVTIREAMNCTCKHRLVGKRLPGAHGRVTPTPSDPCQMTNEVARWIGIGR